MKPELRIGRALFAWCVLLAVPVFFFVVMTHSGDRDDTLFATPEAQTEYRLRMFGRRAEAYFDSSGHMPSRIEDLLKAGESKEQRRDAWGQSIQYETAGDGFALRSPGPDGVSGSDDDIVIRGSPMSRSRPDQRR